MQFFQKQTPLQICVRNLYIYPPPNPIDIRQKGTYSSTGMIHVRFVNLAIQLPDGHSASGLLECSGAPGPFPRKNLHMGDCSSVESVGMKTVSDQSESQAKFLLQSCIESLFHSIFRMCTANSTNIEELNNSEIVLDRKLCYPTLKVFISFLVECCCLLILHF